MQSSRMSVNRTTRSWSRASSSHGATFASWSSRVTTTSSPALHSRAAARVRAKLSVVMFAPNTTSSGEQPSQLEPVRRALATSASVARLVEYSPPTFAFASRR